MRWFKNVVITVALVAAIASAGCHGTPVTIESPPNVSYDSSKGRLVSASATGFQLLLLIPISINDRHERAYEALQVQVGDDYLTDVKIQESWTYALVGTLYTVKMVGTAYPRN